MNLLASITTRFVCFIFAFTLYDTLKSLLKEIVKNSFHGHQRYFFINNELRRHRRLLFFIIIIIIGIDAIYFRCLIEIYVPIFHKI